MKLLIFGMCYDCPTKDDCHTYKKLQLKLMLGGTHIEYLYTSTDESKVTYPTVLKPMTCNNPINKNSVIYVYQMDMSTWVVE